MQPKSAGMSDLSGIKGSLIEDVGLVLRTSRDCVQHVAGGWRKLSEYRITMLSMPSQGCRPASFTVCWVF